MKVAVISGGFSEEQHSSRKSGKGIAAALENLGHTVQIIEYDSNLIDNLKKFSPNAAFPIVQGKYHSDGTVHALLRLAGIAYVGSEPCNAAVINHKTLCKKIWRTENILTPDFFEYSHKEYLKDGFEDFKAKINANNLTLPVVVKPPTQGGRFGMVFVEERDSFEKLKESFVYDDVLLVEKYIKGRFFTQGIAEINGVITALPPVEVIDNSHDEFKRFSGNIAVIDHDFTPEKLEEINGITLKAAYLTGASGLARLDYHLSLSDGRLYLLEINAAPGMMPGYSSMNKCAEAAGYGYDKFIELLLASAK